MFKYGFVSYVKKHCQFSHTEESNGIIKEIYYDENGRKYALNNHILSPTKKTENLGYAFFPTKEQREKRKKLLEELSKKDKIEK